MIIGSLTQTKRFEILHPDFKKVFEYVRSGNWQQVTAGKIILEEDKIWVNVDEVTGKSREAAKLEAHNRFSPGEFVIFFPEDAHAPCIGNGKMKKMVVKVKL